MDRNRKRVAVHWTISLCNQYKALPDLFRYSVTGETILLLFVLLRTAWGSVVNMAGRVARLMIVAPGDEEY